VAVEGISTAMTEYVHAIQGSPETLAIFVLAQMTALDTDIVSMAHAIVAQVGPVMTAQPKFAPTAALVTDSALMPLAFALQVTLDLIVH